MNRRGFLGAILAAGVAPAIVKAEILMPCRAVKVASTAEIQAYLNKVYNVIYEENRAVLEAQFITGLIFGSAEWTHTVGGRIVTRVK